VHQGPPHEDSRETGQMKPDAPGAC
jgi:hypothetical protein